MTTESIRQCLMEQVERSFDEQCSFLSTLVGLQSLVGAEGDAQAFYSGECARMGLKVKTIEACEDTVRSHPAYVPIGYDYSGRPNVVARCPGAGRGRSLILNGHVDVVSPEPLSSWTVDPWGGVIKGNRLYGRGAADMKAGLAANYFALKAVLDCGYRPDGDVILESVIEEEAGGSGGTLACFMDGVMADAMVIPEPTGENIWITHPGIKYFRITVRGLPAHAARSHEGVNAIVKIMPIVAALDALDRERARRLSYPLVEKQRGRSCNLNLGKLIAGDWASTVAGWASLECRIGFVPGETGSQVVREIQDTVAAAVRGDAWCEKHPPVIEWFGWDAEPWLEPEDSPLVTAFGDTFESAFHTRPALAGGAGGLDTRFGPIFGTPSLSFGPRGENYHGIDEYVQLDSLLTVTKALAVFIADWCGVTSETSGETLPYRGTTLPG